MSQALGNRDAQALFPGKPPFELGSKGRQEPTIAERTGGGLSPGAPSRIANRLRVDFPDDESMRISHEAIYQALYIQGRGALKRELVACLRTGRALRVPRARTRASGKQFVTPEVMISERPAEATSSSGWKALRSARSSSERPGSRCSCIYPAWTATASNRPSRTVLR